MKKLLLLSLLIFLTVNNAKAAINNNPQSMEESAMNNPQSMSGIIMTQYDFNHNGMVPEREFIIMDGDTNYRTHISNIYKSLDLEHKGNIELPKYWFIELAEPAIYQQNLSDYFKLLDQDGDGFITTQTYVNTYKGKDGSTLGYKYAWAIDSNQDGLISEDEYKTFDFTTLPSGSHEVFQNFDINKDGIITPDDLLEYFKAVMQH